MVYKHAPYHANVDLQSEAGTVLKHTAPPYWYCLLAHWCL